MYIYEIAEKKVPVKKYFFSVYHIYEQYWPIEHGTKKAEQNVEVDYNWDKKIGQVLDVPIR